MRLKSTLLGTTLGLALLAVPALAQTGPAPMSPPMAPQGASPMAAPPMAEPGMHHHRHHGMHSERRAERRAMREENRGDAAGMVEAAREALRRGRTAEASNLLEQSETRLLTRSVPTDRAGQPMRSPALESLAAARSAIRSRDRAGADTQMQQAIAVLLRDRNGMASGADAAAPMMPMGNQGMSGQGMGSQGMSGPGMSGQGMGSQGMPGRAMQDGGTAGSSMSRADGILRVQAGGTNSPQDMRNRRDGTPMTTHGTINHGAGGVGAAPPPGAARTPQVSGGGRSSSGGAVTMGTPSSGNASGTTTPSTPSQGNGR